MSGQAVNSTGFNRPPAGVDEALRARILEFYQLEQQGRFRQAEGLVCEESKDIYYDSEKRRWTSVEIMQIQYEEDFSKATATVALGSTVMSFGGSLPVKIPLTSIWRVENGSWCRYMPPPKPGAIRSPFAIPRSDAPVQLPKPSPSPVNPAVAASAPPPIPTDPRSLRSMIRISREEVSLGAAGMAETVEIQNQMPGSVDVILTCPNLPGLTCQLSAPKIETRGTARLTLILESPNDAQPAVGDVMLLIEPLGIRKTIRVRIQP